MGFGKRETDQLLAHCGRRCCICGHLHAVQVHHIKPKEKGGTDDIQNGIPLCPNCHDAVHTGYSSGKTTKIYSEPELKLHRQRTIEQIKNGNNSGRCNAVSNNTNTVQTETKVDEIATGVEKILKEETRKAPPKISEEISALIDEAKSLLNQGKYEEGRVIAQNAFELANESENKVAIGRAKFLLAVVLLEWDRRHKEAVNLLNESLADFKSSNSDGDVANALVQLGVIAIDEGRLDEASAFMSQALEIYKRNVDKIRIAQALDQLGWIEDQRGHSKNAFELSDEAIKYFFSGYIDSAPEEKNRSAHGIAGCYRNKGLIYKSEGRIIDAESSYMRALDWVRKTDSKGHVGAGSDQDNYVISWKNGG